MSAKELTKKNPKRSTARKVARKKISLNRRAPKMRFAVQGNITAKRDVIMGDQTNYIDNRKQIANIASPQEFVSELEKVRAELLKLKAAPNLSLAEVRRVEVVEADVVEVLEESKKSAPVADRINQMLETASKTMTNMGKAVAGAVTLGTTLAGLGQIALKLFGG